MESKKCNTLVNITKKKWIHINREHTTSSYLWGNRDCNQGMGDTNC